MTSGIERDEAVFDDGAATADPGRRLTRRQRREQTAARGRRRVRHAVNGAVVLALVGGTGAFALVQDDVAPEDVTSALFAADDVPADAAALTHLSPWASRGDERPDLEAGEGVALTIVADGETLELRTAADTVGEALAQAGIVVGWEDEVSVELASAPVDGGEVRVVRVTYESVTAEEATAFETEEREDSGLASGNREVVQEGADGLARTTYRVRYVDGVEESREIQVQATLTEPVTEIVRVGTGSSGSGGTTSPPVVYDGTDPRAIALEMVAARGWSDAEFQCLDALWTRESNWNPYAQNPSSGAYGIPQSLPGSKMATAGADWQTNPATQITWGLNYIAGRYGTPCGAWGHSESVGWY
ncbi:G5 domain protein [Beutenbergia cavernae DSM 12333]|uniref:G5 domain protein n=1 Tax=Beutenbergia cavernae (strain ATCC BAA-8 / DSM 12333 / CCUG 43141 / JCM 11478 / NBRC 16432 / NCIMB 13614 / HKI 0122) TaxID=471853 RepID=C5C048_BEUC1|nr:G5 domain-containing protein [Beutenbergia cavernae]ACQ79234.1 G5 domain protein [Beutenbergia cavernae DSM 12333]